MKHALTQMQYRFAVIFGPPSTARKKREEGQKERNLELQKEGIEINVNSFTELAF